MRRYIAHGLAIAFLIVGLGAAQGPNISEATAAPGTRRAALPLPPVRPQARDQLLALLLDHVPEEPGGSDDVLVSELQEFVN